jgi:hypothetical protein
MSIDVGRANRDIKDIHGHIRQRRLQPEPERVQDSNAQTAAGHARYGSKTQDETQLIWASPDAIREHWGRGSFLSGASRAVLWSAD